MLAIDGEYQGYAPNQSEEGAARWLRKELLPKFRAEPLPEPPLTDDDSITLLGKSTHNQIAEFADTYAANGLKKGWIDYQSPPLIFAASDGSGILARPTVSREFLCWEPSPERGSHVTLTEARMHFHSPVGIFLDQPDYRGDRNWNALVPISIFACLLCAARTLRSVARTLGAWVD